MLKKNLISLCVTASPLLAQWSGPLPPVGEPSTADITQGMEELTGIPIAPPPVGVQRPCKCCGAKVEAKYITTTAFEDVVEVLMLGYIVVWRQGTGQNCVKHKDDNEICTTYHTASLSCHTAPIGDWSAVPGSAIPTITYINQNMGGVNAFRYHYPFNILAWPMHVFTECMIPAGEEVPTDQISPWPSNLNHRTPLYRGAIKVPVKYQKQIQTSRWAMVCTNGHDQSVTCDGTGGIGATVPKPTPPLPAKKLLGEWARYSWQSYTWGSF